MYHLEYKGRKIHQFGGIIINDTTYTLNISLNDSKLLRYITDYINVITVSIEGDVKFELRNLMV